MKRFVIRHGDDIIGYCFATTKDKAVAAFHKAHGIPTEIALWASLY